MKNLSLVLNIVLLVAVGVLYVLHFSADKAEPVAVTQTSEEAPKSKAVIAYINSDSLLNNYAFSKDIQDQLKNLEKKYDAEFSNKAKGLEDEIAIFQRTAQSMTIGQAKAREEELLRSRNRLMQYQESLGQKLMLEQAKLQDSLYNKVTDYLKEYGKDQNIDVVLTYTKGSGVLYASDSLDITKSVITALNDRYKATAVKSETKVEATTEKKK